MNDYVIAGRRIGTDAPPYVIAEAGVNHNGRLDLAKRLVDAAAGAGADAVKFQTFKASALVSKGAPKAEYQKETTGAGGDQEEMLEELELDEAAHRALQEHAKRAGITFISTPFDDGSLDLLAGLDLPAIKISSSDVTNLPFLTRVARLRKPVLLSTGMSWIGEVEAAVRALHSADSGPVLLLHCTAMYPTPVEDANLAAIGTMGRAFGLPMGFSDHTTGVATGAMAVMAGAVLLEKHLTLDKAMPGPDHRASLDPAEMAAYVRYAREAAQATGDGVKRPRPGELPVKTVMQKSVVAARRIAAGEVLTGEMLVCKRPATGLAPAEVARLVGLRALREIVEGEQLTFAAVG